VGASWLTLCQWVCRPKPGSQQIPLQTNRDILRAAEGRSAGADHVRATVVLQVARAEAAWALTIPFAVGEENGP